MESKVRSSFELSQRFTPAYGLEVLHTESFREQPLATLWRSLLWLTCHIGPKRKAVISVKVGATRFKLDLPPLLKRFGSTGIFVQRHYYEPLLRFCDRLVKAGDVAIDCGANQGIYACAFAALAGPKGGVIACEPQPYAIAALRNNLKINGFRQVWIEEAAISDREGDALLDLSCGATAASIVHDLGRRRTMRVRTVPLSKVASRRSLTRLDLIKMDIEGAEYPALVGARDLIDAFRPVIVMEGGRHDKHLAEISQFMAARGYLPHLFTADGGFVPISELGDSHPCIVYLNGQKNLAASRFA